MSSRNDIWAVVLAGGEGTRLAPLTRRLYGDPLPKQFATLVGDRSLLQETIARFSPLVPPARMVVVVPEGYDPLARRQLASWPGVHVVPQPANRGTGPGVLLPLALVLASDPDARTLVVPSDHYVPRPAPFLDVVAKTAAVADERPLALIGVAAESPETEYGWIRPGCHLSEPLRAVEGFVEKPSPEVAERLHREGALWNTFLMVARGRALWDAAAARMPAHATAIRQALGASAERGALARAYATLRPANFSQEVLETTPGLAVAPVEGSGWADWGSPRRVFASLRHTPHLAALKARLRSPRHEQGFGGNPGGREEQAAVLAVP
jgi:mannose-1-phosphate guanylyltransferase